MKLREFVEMIEGMGCAECRVYLESNGKRGLIWGDRVDAFEYFDDNSDYRIDDLNVLTFGSTSTNTIVPDLHIVVEEV